MPKIDANVQEATVGRWLKPVGQWVDAGEAIVELVTDKASFELECEHAGVLRQRTAPAKTVAPVGYVIALLSDTQDEPLPDVSGENEQIMRRYAESLLAGPAEGPRAAISEAPARGASAPGAGHAGAIKATPAARRLAGREGVRLEDLPGAGQRLIQPRHVLDYLAGRGGTGKGGGNAG